MAVQTSIYKHKMLLGQTLKQIAELYGTSYEQIAQDNDLMAEIADDNDFTGTELNISLPSLSDGGFLFNQRYEAFVSLVVNSSANTVEESLDQFFSYLNQSIEDVYQRLQGNFGNNSEYPNANLYLHTAHSSWKYFCANDDSWRLAMFYVEPQYKTIMGGYEISVGLNRAALMKARVEQLFADEVAFEARSRPES